MATTGEKCSSKYFYVYGSTQQFKISKSIFSTDSALNGSIITSHLVYSPFQVPPILSTTNVFTFTLSNFSLTSYSISILWLSTLCLGKIISFSQSSLDSKVSRCLLQLLGKVLIALFFVDHALSYVALHELTPKNQSIS